MPFQILEIVSFFFIESTTALDVSVTLSLYSPSLFFAPSIPSFEKLKLEIKSLTFSTNFSILSAKK